MVEHISLSAACMMITLSLSKLSQSLNFLKLSTMSLSYLANCLSVVVAAIMINAYRLQFVIHQSQFGSSQTKPSFAKLFYDRRLYISVRICQPPFAARESEFMQAFLLFSWCSI